jgi:hypothetical protein
VGRRIQANEEEGLKMFLDSKWPRDKFGKPLELPEETMERIQETMYDRDCMAGEAFQFLYGGRLKALAERKTERETNKERGW